MILIGVSTLGAVLVGLYAACKGVFGPIAGLLACAVVFGICAFLVIFT